MCKRNGVIFPLVLILVGIYFLLRNYGVLPESFEIGKIWPAILIAVGVGALFCRRDSCGHDKDKPTTSQADQ